jgi:hypothetical protein
VVPSAASADADFESSALAGGQATSTAVSRQINPRDGFIMIVVGYSACLQENKRQQALGDLSKAHQRRTNPCFRVLGAGFVVGVLVVRLELLPDQGGVIEIVKARTASREALGLSHVSLSF